MKKKESSMLTGEVNITYKPYEIKERRQYEMSPTFSIINEREISMDKRRQRKRMSNKNNRRYVHNE